MNVARNLENAASYFPDNTAIIDGEQEVSYLEFNRDAGRIAASLIKQGVKLGDHIALFTPNSYNWLAFYFGILKAGAVAVTLASGLTKLELPPILDNCKPKMIFTVDEKLDVLGDMGRYPYIEKVISNGNETSYASMVREGPAGFEGIDRRRNDPAAILYTAGTTGVPKGAVLTHQNLSIAAHNVAHNERSTEKDRALCFLPLNHVFAQCHIMHSVVNTAGGLTIMGSFDLDRLLDVINRRHITKFYAVPTLYYRMLALDNLAERIAPVRYCFSAAASMAGEVVKDWKVRTGLNIHEAYGMTESSSMVTFNHYHRHVVGSVGTPVNLIEVQIRDTEGNRVPTGEAGEICISGPNIMKEYLNNPEETKNAFWEEWFRSGDIGAIREDGHLYILDRLKDLIITGGENVFPREVEEALYTCQEVLECAVVGLPDKEYGERVVACLVAKPGQEIDTAAIRSYLKGRMTGFKVPKQFICMEALPKSATGKTLKRELREQLKATNS